MASRTPCPSGGRMRQLIWTMLFLSLAAPAHAGKGFGTKDEVVQWMTNYYRRPEPDRVIDALPFLDANGDEVRAVTGGAARWSLTSNAVQHPRVLEICEVVAGRQKPGEGANLRAVIAAAKQQLKKDRLVKGNEHDLP